MLTAYLDNELDDRERQLVEARLAADEHWRQLLKELQSVRSLLRELPKPVLASSLVNGPWKDASYQNPSVVAEANRAAQSGRKVPASALMALAASLLLCVWGAYRWLRSEGVPAEIALREQIAEPMRASPHVLAPTTTEDQNRRELTANAPPATQSSASPLEQADKTNRGAIALSLPSESRIQQRQLKLSEPLEETLLVVRKKTLAVRSDDYLLAKPTGRVTKDVEMSLPQATANPTNTFYFLEPESELPEDISSLQLNPNKRYELRLLRSDLPAMMRRLGELGFELQTPGPRRENELKLSSSDEITLKSNAENKKAATQSAMEHPKVIEEPSTWIRVVIEAEQGDQ
jgi:hypothetical protein